MVKNIITEQEIIAIDLESSESSGGKTGSVRVKGEDGIYYQYKPPITDNSLLRQVKSKHTDSENFSELLASRVAGLFDPEKKKPRVPYISFVTDPKSSRVAIASQYLKGDDGAVVQSLDDYLGKPSEKPHIKLISGHSDPQKGLYNIDIDLPLKKELARAIALSALVGDHDVNPGNMIVIKQSNGTIRLGRIDYGHAFKDLMRFFVFGGRATHKNNIIDFFNRHTVDGPSAQSKLWRDYPGLTPSREMANALKEVVNNQSAIKNINVAIDKVRNEVEQLIANKDIDKEHIISSFQRIAEHVSEEQMNAKLDDNERMDFIFQKLKDYIHTNLQQMVYAAKIMHLQVDIQQAILNGKTTTVLKNEYDALEKEGSNINIGPFTWFKEREKSQPYQGDFEQFVQHQKIIIKLNKIAHNIDKFLSTNPSESEQFFSKELKKILAHPKQSAEDKVSSLRKKIRDMSTIPQSKSILFLEIIKSICKLFIPANPLQLDSRLADGSLNHEIPQIDSIESFKDLKTKFQKLFDSEELEPDLYDKKNNF